MDIVNKFILVGTDLNPKKDYLLEGETITQYRLDLLKAITNYPGSLIFTTFKKSPESLNKNEVYANGQLYRAESTSPGIVFYGLEPVLLNGLINNFSLLHNGETPLIGNIYVYDPNDLLHKTLNGNIADCIAYYYNGVKWVAFTGNINIDNIWLNDDIILAGEYTLIGNINKSLDGTGTLNVTNKNLKLVLEDVFTKEVYPSNITEPIYNFSTYLQSPEIILYDYNTKKLILDGDSVEIGTKLSLLPIVQNNSSSLESITVSGLRYGYKIGNDISKDTLYIKTAIPKISRNYDILLISSGFINESGTISEFNAVNIDGDLTILESNLWVSRENNTLTLTEVGLTYTSLGFELVILYPLSNLGNTYNKDGLEYYISIKLDSGIVNTPMSSTKISIKGYYPIFYKTFSTINTDFSGSSFKENWISCLYLPTNIVAPKGTIQIAIAIPYNGTSEPSISLKNIENSGNGFTGIDSFGSLSNITGNLYSNYITHSYKVLYAQAAIGTSNENVYTITYNN